MKIENNRLFTKKRILSRDNIDRSSAFLILKNTRYGCTSRYTLKEYYIRYIKSLYYKY